MRKLNGLNKSNKKRNFIVISAFLFVCLLVVGISYAVYQKTDEIQFINAKVGEFDTSNSDIELAMIVDGEEVSIPPGKGFYNVLVECDHADGDWNSEKWLAEIGNITSNRVKCNVNFESYKLSIQDVKVGDYLSMTPTSTSYTIPTSLTGYTSNQTINPSELNLWRVIRKNEDGTVEVVSEYVSSTDVYFRGQTAYMNFVGALNSIAEQYTNELYVSKTRHIGYSNQIEYCASFSSSACPGDTGYTVDTNLVKIAIGTLKATIPDGSPKIYYLSSRYYVSQGYVGCYWVVNDGTLGYGQGFIDYDKVRYFNAPIRPILTLKKDVVIISGDGKSADTAYQFE